MSIYVHLTMFSPFVGGGNMTNDSQYVAKDVSSLLDYTIINKADIDHVSDTIEFLAIR